MTQLPDTASRVLTTPTINPISLQGVSHFPKPSSAGAAEMAVYFFDSSALVKRHVDESRVSAPGSAPSDASQGGATRSISPASLAVNWRQ